MIASPPTSSDKTAALLTHLSGIFFGPIVSGIIYFATAKNPWLKDQARNALNFQLTILIAWIVVSVLHWGSLYRPLELVNVILCIIAAIKANTGDSWRYPAAIEFVKL